MRRMKTIGELFADLKSYFVNKTNTGVETIAGDLKIHSIITADFGECNNLLVRSKCIDTNSYYACSFRVMGNTYFGLVKYSSVVTASCVSDGGIRYVYTGSPNATFNNIISKQTYALEVIFTSVTSINTSLGGTPTYGIENSTLHIRGSFTPTSNIASGSKLFSTGQSLNTKMTDDSAINTGSTGAETFVGISIQTNGDVYCLGALTSGVTYNIAVATTI